MCTINIIFTTKSNFYPSLYYSFLLFNMPHLFLLPFWKTKMWNYIITNKNRHLSAFDIFLKLAGLKPFSFRMVFHWWDCLYPNSLFTPQEMALMLFPGLNVKCCCNKHIGEYIFELVFFNIYFSGKYPEVLTVG